MKLGRVFSFAGLQWLLVTAAVAGTLVADAVINWESTLYRVLMLTGGAVVALGIVATTPQGRALVKLFGEARGELRRMVWPTRPETAQTTLLVMIVVAVLGMVLWGMDYLLGLATGQLLG